MCGKPLSSEHIFLSNPMVTLTITILEATDLRETELLGKQDPYVEIKTDNETRNTTVKQNAGRNAGMDWVRG